MTKKILVNNNNSAVYLGCSPNSLKKSRITGLLFGVEAPAYLKMGNKTIRYKLETLDKWLEQFTEQQNTAQ